MASFLFNGLAAEMGEDRLRQMALIWMAEVDARNRLKDEFLAAGRVAADRLQEMLRAGPLFPPGFRFYEEEELNASPPPGEEEQEEEEQEQASVVSSIPPPPPEMEENALDGWPEIEIDLEAGDGAPLSPASMEPRPLFQPADDQEGMNQLLELAGGIAAGMHSASLAGGELLGLRELADARPPPAEEPPVPAAPARLLQTHILRISPNVLEITEALRTGVLRPQKPSICWGPRSKNSPSAPMPAAVLHSLRENGPQSVKNLQRMLVAERLAHDQREAQEVVKQMTLQGVLILA